MDSTCIFAKLDQFDAIIFSLYRMNLTMAMEGTKIKHSRTPKKWIALHRYIYARRHVVPRIPGN